MVDVNGDLRTIDPATNQIINDMMLQSMTDEEHNEFEVSNRNKNVYSSVDSQNSKMIKRRNENPFSSRGSDKLRFKNN